MKKLLILAMFASVFAAACEDPSANKPKAQTADVAAVSTPAPDTQAKAAADGLPITPENSKIEFIGSKVTGKHDGGFKQFSGNIDLQNGKPEDSKVSVTIEMSSVFTDADGLTDHLKTPDFFDVAKYPQASFTSTKIVPDASGGAGKYTVTGDFELHGTKKSIIFPAAITVSDSEVAVNSEFSINRKDFGIVYAGKTDDLIRDGVVIKLDLKAPRKK